MMMELSTDDITSQINNGYERAIGGCSQRALTTSSDEAVVVRDDKSIRRPNLANMVSGRSLKGHVHCYMHAFRGLLTSMEMRISV